METSAFTPRGGKRRGAPSNVKLRHGITRAAILARHRGITSQRAVGPTRVERACVGVGVGVGVFAWVCLRVGTIDETGRSRRTVPARQEIHKLRGIHEHILQETE